MNVSPIIHHVLLSDVPNAEIQRCIDSWDRIEAYGFELKKWNAVEVLGLIKSYYPEIEAPFLHSRNYGEAGDIAKYVILHHYSGYYIDWDIELIHPEKFIDIISTAPNGYLLIDPPNSTYASECFSAIRGEPFLQSLMDDIIEIFHTQKPPPFAPQYTGPFRMRDTMAKHQNASQRVFPVKSMFEYDFSEIRNPHSGEITRPLIHYWLHTWMR